MEKKLKKRRVRHTLSEDRYRRRTVAEMTQIVSQIQSGGIGIRAASRKHRICRPTLQRWIVRLSVINLGEELSNKLLAEMTDTKKIEALESKIMELTKALELSKLKVDGLQTMVKVAEENFKIKIRKKRGSKQSRE